MGRKASARSSPSRSARRAKNQQPVDPAAGILVIRIACVIVHVAVTLLHSIVFRLKDPRSTLALLFLSGNIFFQLALSNRYTSYVIARSIQALYLSLLSNAEELKPRLFLADDEPVNTMTVTVTAIAAVIAAIAWIRLDNKQRFYGGMVPGPWDPFSEEARKDAKHSAAASYVLAFGKAAALVMVVPLEEEWMFRSLFLSAPVSYFPFDKQLVSVVVAGMIHSNYIGGLATAALYWILRDQVGMWSAVAAHACANALICGYIFATRSWEVWE